jgi:hypothetical protein
MAFAVYSCYKNRPINLEKCFRKKENALAYLEQLEKENEITAQRALERYIEQLFDSLVDRGDDILTESPLSVLRNKNNYQYMVADYDENCNKCVAYCLGEVEGPI